MKRNEFGILTFVTLGVFACNPSGETQQKPSLRPESASATTSTAIPTQPTNAPIAPAAPPAPAASSARAPSATSATSLCSLTETVVFACKTTDKMVSVCASKTISATSGEVKYRFGVPGQSPELELPKDKKAPADSAEGENFLLAGGGGSWLRFANGAYGFVVFSAMGKWGPNGDTRQIEGVVVEKDGKKISVRGCTSDSSGELGPDWFTRAGITGRGKEFDLPVDDLIKN